MQSNEAAPASAMVVFCGLTSTKMLWLVLFCSLVGLVIPSENIICPEFGSDVDNDIYGGEDGTDGDNYVDIVGILHLGVFNIR